MADRSAEEERIREYSRRLGAEGAASISPEHFARAMRLLEVSARRRAQREALREGLGGDARPGEDRG